MQIFLTKISFRGKNWVWVPQSMGTRVRSSVSRNDSKQSRCSQASFSAGSEAERIVLMRCEDSIYLNSYPWIISCCCCCWCQTTRFQSAQKENWIYQAFSSEGTFWHTSIRFDTLTHYRRYIEKCTFLIFYAELCTLMLRAIIHSRLQLTVIVVVESYSKFYSSVQGVDIFSNL